MDIWLGHGRSTAVPVNEVTLLWHYDHSFQLTAPYSGFAITVWAHIYFESPLIAVRPKTKPWMKMRMSEIYCPMLAVLSTLFLATWSISRISRCIGSALYSNNPYHIIYITQSVYICQKTDMSCFHNYVTFFRNARNDAQTSTNVFMMQMNYACSHYHKRQNSKHHLFFPPNNLP